MNTFYGLLIWAAIIIAYWTPAIVGARRRVTNEGSVIVVNLLLGWTVVGWIVAMAMAVRTSTRPAAARSPRGSYSVRNIFRA